MCFILQLYLFILNIQIGGGVYKSKFILWAVGAVRDSSLGVYLIHGWFVYYVVPALGVNNASIIYRTIGAMVIVVISVLCTRVLKRVPILKHIV